MTTDTVKKEVAVEFTLSGKNAVWAEWPRAAA